MATPGVQVGYVHWIGAVIGNSGAGFGGPIAVLIAVGVVGWRLWLLGR